MSYRELLSDLHVVAGRINKKAEIVHSDNEVLKVNAEPAGTVADEPDAESDNQPEPDAPVWPGNLTKPESGNATAIRDALESQVEYEIGKPVTQKEQELKSPEGTVRPEVAEQVKKFPNAVPEVKAAPGGGTQIIINVASEKEAVMPQQEEGMLREQALNQEHAKNMPVLSEASAPLAASPATPMTDDQFEAARKQRLQQQHSVKKTFASSDDITSGHAGMGGDDIGAALPNLNQDKEAGFNMFFPGQVLQEFYPEIQHEIVDYPNANNSPMIDDVDVSNAPVASAVESALDTTKVSYVSTSPGAVGIGRDGKEQILEGAPLRKENDIRGYGYNDEYFGQYEGGPKDLTLAANEDDHMGGAGQMFMEEYHAQYGEGPKLSSKTAADTGERDPLTGHGAQFVELLIDVCAKIAATMVAAFKVTSRPLLDKVPGKGKVQLADTEQTSSLFNQFDTGSRVHWLLENLNDSEIRDAVDRAWAQAAVWSGDKQAGFVYEVFVRPQTVDTDTMVMEYEFIAGTKAAA